MILNGAQIQSLLSQGAITQAQADSLATANNAAPPQPEMQIAQANDQLNQAANSLQQGQRGASNPPPEPSQFVDHSAMNTPMPKNDNGQPPVADSYASVSGAFGAPAQQTSLNTGHSMVPAGQTVSAPPGYAQKPQAEPSDSLKGQNTLTGPGVNPNAGSGGAGDQAGGTPANDPASLYIPKSQWAPANIDPEKRFTQTQLALGKEGIEQSEHERTELQKLGAMRAIADDTAGNIAIQNTAAQMKNQDEDRAAWKSTMDKVAEQSAEITSRAREVESRKIDPDRYWNNKDAAGQAFAVIGVMLGAAGSAINKTPNYAMQIVQSAIERDIDAQKTDISNAYKGLGIEQDEVHSSLQRAQLDSAFKDKMRIEHWEMMKAQTQGMIQKMNAPIEQQKANILLGGIDDKIRENKLSMAQNIYNFEVLQRKANTRPAGTDPKEVRKYITDRKAEFMEKGDNEQDANDRAIKLASERFDLKMEGGQATLPTLEDDKTKAARTEREKMMVNLPNGQKAEARSEAAANEYSKRQMAIGQLASIAQRMEAIRKRNGGGTILNRADVAEARSLQEQAVNQYNEITGFNRAPGQPERTGLKGEVIPDITDFSPSGGIDRKLSSLKTFVQNAYNLNNRTYLKEPPKDNYDVINGNGNGGDFASSIGATPGKK